MFHKIRSVSPLPDMRLCVHFCEGVTKIYDVSPAPNRFPVFNQLKENNLFKKVYVEMGGYAVVWNDDIDIACDELYYNGVEIETPFDGLMAFSDATDIWDLNESTLRKAVQYGKFTYGVDIAKYGNQWVITREAMEREYGKAPEKDWWNRK